MAFNWLKKHFSKTGTTAPEPPAETAAVAEETALTTAPAEETAAVAEIEPPALPEENTEPAAAETVVATAPPEESAEAVTTETVVEALPEENIASPAGTIAEEDEVVAELVTTEEPALAQPQTKPKNESGGYFARIRQGLAKTRRGFADLFLGKKTLDQDLIDDLETQLLTADVGMEVTRNIIDSVTAQIDRKELKDVDAVKAAVRDHMQQLLAPYAQALDTSRAKPYVILMTGINGAGKTTTIGKLARHFQQEGKKVMLAAGDTFRAAAVEQLQTWGARHNVPVIAQGTGADAASVAYDALQSATARGIDVLIIDTAGRLHTQDHLMEELKKIKRVIAKLDPAAPHETMLIIDAGNGQNALRQAEQFHKAMQLDSITVTKLDGTAKGGILFAISEKLGIPIRYIGVGEQPEDLRPFNAQEFVQALLYAE
ncbi:signal recognition particle-docking protein FtsY [Cardiobacterium hominis]|uniref:signal recognition particle-docking protein FtsY n=1 Tax=Cardiobacterium hominis TaxID=2718 RepID=UPI0028D6AE3D|nr:signal recognition particle-docking protein FtsY [Cardiobacterium hominis]